jgi:hypothetical protein
VATDQEAGDHLDPSRQRASKAFGGLRAVGHGPEAALRQRLGGTIEHVAGQLTPGVLGHLACVGLRFFARECSAQGNAENVSRPPPQRDAHDAQDQVQAREGAICLSSGAGAVSVVSAAIHVTTGLFHGAGIAVDGEHGICGGPGGRHTDDVSPQLPAGRVQGASSKDRGARKVFDAGGATHPQRGRDGVVVWAKSPAVGQGGEAVPRRGA